MTKLKKISFVVLLEVFVTNSLAIASNRELSHSKIESHLKSNTDKNSIKTLRIKLKNHRRNIFWPYQFNKITATDYGVDIKNIEMIYRDQKFSGQSISFNLARKFSNNFYLSITPGIHSYEYSEHQYKKNIFSSKLNWIKDKFRAQVIYNHNFEYENQKPFMMDNNPLYSDTIKSNISYQITKHISSSYGQELKYYSDNNQFLQNILELSYKLSYKTVEIILGIAGKSEQSAHKNLLYHSPKSSLSFGPQFTLDFYPSDIVNFSTNFSYEKSVNKRQETGYDLWNETSLSFLKRDSHNFSINYQTSISYTEETWQENKISLTFNLFL